MNFRNLPTQIGLLNVIAPLILLCICTGLPNPALGATLNVAVASNFASPMKAITAQFEAQSGHRVRLSFGASGVFVAQIRQGAPFDVFLSADQDKPNALVKDNLAIADSQFTYAQGRLVLWSVKPALVSDNEQVLLGGGYNRIAIANPKLAPYGRAAIEVLRHLNLEDSTREKWVIGENIAQTFNFVMTGNADMGFIAHSQLLHMRGNPNFPPGSAWQVPRALHPPIRQDAVILKRAARNSAAKALLTFMRSPEAKHIMVAFGYSID